MGEHDEQTMVEDVFRLMEKQDWDGVLEYYHDDAVIEWPQSGERISGKDMCLQVFENYPGGSPKMRARRVVDEGDLVVAETDITYPDGSTWKGVSMFELRDGRIAKETDYFAEPFEAPEWRAQWVERF